MFIGRKSLVSDMVDMEYKYVCKGTELKGIVYDRNPETLNDHGSCRQLIVYDERFLQHYHTYTTIFMFALISNKTVTIINKYFLCLYWC